MNHPQPIRVQVLSDIHAEFGPHAIPQRDQLATGADIVVIAGDLGTAGDNVRLAARLFPDTPALVLIAGNHEHYGTNLPIDDGIGLMRQTAGELSGGQNRVIVALEDEQAIVHVRGVAVRILGATLWTDYGLRHQPISDAMICQASINDHRCIRGQAGGLMQVREASARHRASRAFLTDAFAEPHHGPTIAVTHHLPSIRSVAGRFRGVPTTSAFASHLDDLVGMGSALWVHGHTHDSCTWRDGGGTLVVCNPAGYAREAGGRENESFDPRLCVALQALDDRWRAEIEAVPDN